MVKIGAELPIEVIPIINLGIRSILDHPVHPGSNTTLV